MQISMLYQPVHTLYLLYGIKHCPQNSQINIIRFPFSLKDIRVAQLE